VFGDHVHSADGKAVLGSPCLAPAEFHFLAHIRLEIGTAGSDLESFARVVFRNGVVAVRATQAAFNVDLV
jgi:hypothetical protein